MNHVVQLKNIDSNDHFFQDSIQTNNVSIQQQKNSMSCKEPIKGCPRTTSSSSNVMCSPFDNQSSRTEGSNPSHNSTRLRWTPDTCCVWVVVSSCCGVCCRVCWSCWSCWLCLIRAAMRCWMLFHCCCCRGLLVVLAPNNRSSVLYITRPSSTRLFATCNNPKNSNAVVHRRRINTTVRPFRKNNNKFSTKKRL